jgi:transposase
LDHPQAVVEKAQRLEQLLLHLEAGEAFEPTCTALELHVKEKDIPRLQAKYDAGGRNWEVLIDGRYGHPLKVNSAVRQWMYERKKEDESLTAGELAKELAATFQVDLSVGQINYLLRKVELTRPRGRPPKQKAAGTEPAEPETTVEGNVESVEHAGLFFPGGGEAGDGGGS